MAWPKLAALCFAMMVADLPLAHFLRWRSTFYFIFKLLAKPFNFVCGRVSVTLVLARDTSDFFYDLCFRFKGGSGGNLRVYGT